MKMSRIPLSIAVTVIAVLVLSTASALAYSAAASTTPPTRPTLAAPTASAQQAPATSQSPPAPQDAATSFIGFVAATPEGKLLASNVPVAAAPGGEPRMMVLRRDGTPVSPEESNVSVLRNPDGTLTVQRTDEGEAGTTADAPPTGERVMVVPAGQAADGTTSSADAKPGQQGDTTATTPPAAAGQGDATAPPTAGQGEQTFVVGGADEGGEGAAAMNWVSDDGGESSAPVSDEALQFTEFVIDEGTEVIGTMVPGMPVLVAFEEVDGVKIARRIEVLGG